ncbi:hypothetical protein ES708_31247 [subsurface metagenome]
MNLSSSGFCLQQMLTGVILTGIRILNIQELTMVLLLQEMMVNHFCLLKPYLNFLLCLIIL